MKRFDLQQYLIESNHNEGEFKLFGLSPELQVELINHFTFLTDFDGISYKVNVHSNKGNVMIVKDFSLGSKSLKKLK